jgi:hypothetical protein
MREYRNKTKLTRKPTNQKSYFRSSRFQTTTVPQIAVDRRKKRQLANHI